MTYCCGILVRDGLVMFADTRTNAGVDNISTFRKLHVFSKPGERIIGIATAGNLSISQSVVSMLREGWENPETGETETLMTAPTLFQAAQRAGLAASWLEAVTGRWRQTTIPATLLNSMLQGVASGTPARAALVDIMSSGSAPIMGGGNGVRIGDWVRLDDVSGRVVEVRWRHTAIRTRNGERVIVPNSALMKAQWMVARSTTPGEASRNTRPRARAQLTSANRQASPSTPAQTSSSWTGLRMVLRMSL